MVRVGQRRGLGGESCPCRWLDLAEGGGQRGGPGFFGAERQPTERQRLQKQRKYKDDSHDLEKSLSCGHDTPYV